MDSHVIENNFVYDWRMQPLSMARVVKVSHLIAPFSTFEWIHLHMVNYILHYPEFVIEETVYAYFLLLLIITTART
jgi:hypothetical protein